MNISEQYFFPKRAAFNLTWSEKPKRTINNHITPKGLLTKPGMDGHDDGHSAWYEGFPSLVTT